MRASIKQKGEFAMILVAKEDVLKGLKKFKRLAKQDLLASPLTSNPDFWSQQAEGRRNTYARIMDEINTHGVDHAYHSAVKKYAGLPLFDSKNPDPDIVGARQALEMFFALVGKPNPKIENLENLPTEGGEFTANAQSY